MHDAKAILKIDLDIIRNNYLSMQSLTPKAKVGATVKADCYGLGMSFIAPALEKKGCQHFFVANIEEGLELRKSISNASLIYVLNGVYYNNAEIMQEKSLIPVICNVQQLDLWKATANHFGKKLKTAIHIDTGLNRMAMPVNDFYKIIKDKTIYDYLDINMIMSHFASSNEPENEDNINQLNIFKECCKYLPNEAKDCLKSIASSGGVFLGQENHFDVVRSGGALYGLSVHPKSDKYTQNPVSIFAPIIHCSQLAIGDKVGYNGKFIAPRVTKVATISMGYADGLPRRFSNKGKLYINNIPVPIIGKISMDLCNIDVTDIDDADCFVGQKVEIIGPNQTPDQFARIINSDGYEIITSLGNRFKKVYT